MGFWGVEVIPGKPQPYDSDNVQGSLYVTQATLGLGSDTKRSILQCAVGNKDPVFLCSLLPGKSECCSLNLEFKDEGVTFSVIGTRSIHLSGYFVTDEGDRLREEYEFDSEEGVADTESDYESDADEDYSDDSVEYVDGDDAEMFAPSPAQKSGVVIEEMVDEETPKVPNDLSKRKKKKKSKDAEKQTKPKARSPVADSESEDEDGFPISAQQTAKAALPSSEKKDPSEELADGTQDIKGKKRKEQDNQQEVKKNKKKLKETGDVDSENMDDYTDDNSSQPKEANKQASLDEGKSTSAGKKLKKKKKTGQQEEGHTDNQILSDAGKSSSLSEENQSTAKSSQVRTFSNGLVIKELNMRVPDGERVPVKVVYSVVPCAKRLSVLISFLRRNTGKTLVFFETWYSVEFHGALLKDLGFTAYNSHGTDSGRQKHAAFRAFRDSRNRAAILCATNVPGGEKIPDTVNRIIQFDPPRGAEDFLRCKFGRDPRNLLFLRPQEESFLKLLEDAEVTPTLFDMSEDLKQPPIPNYVVGGSFRLTRLAHRAYSGYIHTYRKHKLQQIFDPDSLLPEEVAPCFGLCVPPTAADLAACRVRQVSGKVLRNWKTKEV